MSRHKPATDTPATHIYKVQFRPYPDAPWGSPYPFADAPTFSAPEEAQAEAACGDHGETRVLCYRLESVGPVIALPVDVPRAAGKQAAEAGRFPDPERLGGIASW